jgi:hypothetical protein
MAKRTGGRSLEGNSGDLTPALILPFSMPRRFGNPEGERARKAATARIRRITDARPELGAHLAAPSEPAPPVGTNPTPTAR